MSFWEKHWEYFGLRLPAGVPEPVGLWRFGVSQSSGNNAWSLDISGRAHHIEPSPGPGSMAWPVTKFYGLIGATTPNLGWNNDEFNLFIDPNPNELRIAKFDDGSGDASLTIEYLSTLNATGAEVSGWGDFACLRRASSGPPSRNHLYNVPVNVPFWPPQASYQFFSEYDGGVDCAFSFDIPFVRDKDVIYIALTISADGYTKKLYLNGVLAKTVTTGCRAEKPSTGDPSFTDFTVGRSDFGFPHPGINFGIRAFAFVMNDDQILESYQYWKSGLAGTLGPQWSKNITDDDGRFFLPNGGRTFDTRMIPAVGTSNSFDDPTNHRHWGAARDGSLHVNGETTLAPGDTDFDLGTIASGLNRRAWRDDQEPHALIADANPFPGTLTYPVDGTIRMTTGPSTGGWTREAWIASALRWYLEGDFVLDIDVANLSKTSGTSFHTGIAVGFNVGGTEGQNSFRIGYQDIGGVTQWEKSRFDNGVYGGNATLATVATAATLRIQRTGSSLRAWVDEGGGFVEVGSAVSPAFGAQRVFVYVQILQDTATGTADYSNMILQSGTISKLIGWAAVPGAAGTPINPAETYRGTQGPMPTGEIAVVCGSDARDTPSGTITEELFRYGGVSFIDKENDKLWFRLQADFLGLLTNSQTVHANERNRRVRFDNGLLLVCSDVGGGSEGDGSWHIDFTTGRVRLVQQSAGGNPGNQYGGAAERSVDAVARANDGLSYANPDSPAWSIAGSRDAYDCAIFRDGFLEYTAWALESTRCCLLRRDIRNLLGSPNRLFLDPSSFIGLCEFDNNGRLYYSDDSTLYSVNRASWEPAMGGPGFPDVYSGYNNSEAIPGTLSHHGQRRIVIIERGALTDVYLVRDEGVYKHLSWPNNSFVLYYGKVGSGAAYEILPDHDFLTAIATDGDNIAVAMGHGFRSEDLVTTDFEDDYENGTIEGTQDLGNGSANEASGALSLTCPNGVNCAWNTTSGGTYNGPIVYHELGTIQPNPSNIVRFELRLESFVKSGIDSGKFAGLTLWRNRDQAYRFGYRTEPAVSQIILHLLKRDPLTSVNYGGVLGTRNTANVAAPSPGNEHIYRIYWNPHDYPVLIYEGTTFVLAGRSMSFFYSVDDGATFTNLWHPRQGQFEDFRIEPSTNDGRIGFFTYTYDITTGYGGVVASASYIRAQDMGQQKGPVVLINPEIDEVSETQETIDVENDDDQNIGLLYVPISIAIGPDGRGVGPQAV
jgi:hypothetical protein